MNAKKILDTSVILVFSSMICVIANMVGYKTGLYETVVGTAVLVAIGIVGFALAQLPYLNKIYAVIWVSALAIFLSSAAFPWSPWIVAVTRKIEFASLSTVILTFAGLSVGKDLEMFKRISWRIVPVALVMIAGTFLCAALIAHFALRWEGAI
jgi:hypothetical protein